MRLLKYSKCQKVLTADTVSIPRPVAMEVELLEVAAIVTAAHRREEDKGEPMPLLATAGKVTVAKPTVVHLILRIPDKEGRMDLSMERMAGEQKVTNRYGHCHHDRSSIFSNLAWNSYVDARKFPTGKVLRRVLRISLSRMESYVLSRS